MKKSVVLILCMLFAVPSFAEDTVVTEKAYIIQKCSSPAGTVMVGKVLCKAATCNKDQTPQNAFIQGLLSLKRARMTSQRDRPWCGPHSQETVI